MAENADKNPNVTPKPLVTKKENIGRTCIFGLGHGGHLLDANRQGAVEQAAKRESDVLVAAPDNHDVVEFTTPFCYLFEGLKRQWPNKHLPNDKPEEVVGALKALADAMIEADSDGAAQPADSIIPAIYTYWGQFIDHDVTANTDRDIVFDITQNNLQPIPPDDVLSKLKNLRQPSLNLETVYADGPTLVGGPNTAAKGFYNGVKFRIGRNEVNPTSDGFSAIPAKAQVPPPSEDLDRDLPRIGKLLDAKVITEDDIPLIIKDRPNKRQTAYIGDERNDENLIIAQFHLAFLRFHNAVVDQISAQAFVNDALLFENARNLTRWHYQWLVVHDFLKTVCLPGIPDQVLLGRPKHYYARYAEPFMALEFSVAAYRFGHSMVRAVYDFNRNFGSNFGNPGLVLSNSPFNLLFTFTGKGSPDPFAKQGETLPFSWIIEWDRFIDHGSPFPFRFTRKIDTRLAPLLHELLNEGNSETDEAIKKILKQLAQRNLLRGYLLSLPTGQAVAEELGVKPLTEAELRQNNTDALNAALDQGEFIEKTPLWYYVLKEAEVRANGNSLGELGSRIVCEIIIGLLYNDPSSYLNQPGGWDPSKGVKLPHGELIVTIADFLRFAKVLGPRDVGA
jgi:hypothetical protein